MSCPTTRRILALSWRRRRRQGRRVGQGPAMRRPGQAGRGWRTARLGGWLETGDAAEAGRRPSLGAAAGLGPQPLVTEEVLDARAVADQGAKLLASGPPCNRFAGEIPPTMGAGIDGRAECQTHQLRPLTISATGWHGAVSSLSADLEAQWHVFRRRDLYRTTIARNNNCALAHNNLGLLLAKMGQVDEAMAHLQKALEINPNYGDAHFNLGFVLADMGRRDEAIAHFRKAVEIDPDAIGALRDRALALPQRGQLTGAASLLKRALALTESVGDEARAKPIAHSLGRL